MQLTEMVVGFLFNESGNRLALIRKTHPAWQAGNWNGIGGRIEAGETPAQAMVREFKEEAGVELPEEEWRLRVRIRGSDFFLYVFSAFSDDVNDCVTRTQEMVSVWDLSSFLNNCYNRIPNLVWMIPILLDENIDVVDIEYVPMHPKAKYE